MGNANSKNSPPSLNGDNRDDGGKFARGHKGGPGNPIARQVNQLRVALAKAVTKEDVRAIAKSLIRQARKGNVAAAKEVFDRLFGKANQPVQLSGEVSGNVSHSVNHTFNHARFAELFERTGTHRTGESGRRADSPNGN